MSEYYCKQCGGPSLKKGKLCISCVTETLQREKAFLAETVDAYFEKLSERGVKGQDLLDTRASSIRRDRKW